MANQFTGSKIITWEINKNGCWICKNHGINTSGYPMKRWFGKKKLISHIFYEKYKGEITNGLQVLHTCDNPLCINPDHLWLGTQFENIKDRDAKNRVAHGENHFCAKLTERDIVEIRKSNKRHIHLAVQIRCRRKPYWKNNIEEKMEACCLIFGSVQASQGGFSWRDSVLH